MDDNNPKNDDDDFADDDVFELEEFEDDDDFDDESWDEFDDEADSPPIEDEETAAQPIVQKRSFVQKYFIFIVVGIVLVFGGIIFLSLTGGSPSPDPRTQEEPVLALTGEDKTDTPLMPTEDTETVDSGFTQEIEELSAAETLPPMPAPINSIQEETETLPLKSDEILTPIPTVETIENMELEELEIPEIAAIPPSEKIEEIDFFLETEEKSEQEDTPDIFEEEMVVVETDKTDNVMDVEKDIQKNDPIFMTDPEPAQENATDEKIEDLENRITNLGNTLSEKIENTDQKIYDLLSSLEMLEAKISDLIEQENAAISIASPPPEEDKKTTVVSETEKVTETPKPKPPKKSVTKPVKKTVQWQLRAAQPGKAIIAPKGSNDFKTLEIGDKLEGLGTIKTIAHENGRWIVRGTTGSISQ